jgi:hypothetical protein
LDRPALEEPSTGEEAGPLIDSGFGKLKNVVLGASGLYIEAMRRLIAFGVISIPLFQVSGVLDGQTATAAFAFLLPV